VLQVSIKNTKSISDVDL